MQHEEDPSYILCKRVTLLVVSEACELTAMAEIVPAEPIDDIHFERGETSTARHHFPLAITDGSSSSAEYVPGPFDSERLPTVFASEIQRFLRVANLVEREEPRVAYLCESALLSGVFLFYFFFVFSSVA